MRYWQRVVSMTAAIGVLAALLLSFQIARPEPAEAAVGSQFNAGNIISDAVFYNSSSMTEAQIQAFLNQQVPNCRAGYTCLKDYRETTKSQPARVEGCAAYTGRAQTAASIIASVAQACGINPQVLLVLLEKEQSLVGDSWPTARQYRSATGYACPDTADCDANFYGFFNQVYHAAYQFKKYQYSPGTRGYQAGRVNTILWHPTASCGSSQVYIENQATAALYIYTPYRPNAAALNNLYGTGDACSSYGNRNFWRIFTDWFGATNGGGNLVRSAESATVYLVVGSTKYPIGDGDTYNAYSPLGPLTYVAQSYLNGLATGRALQRFISNEKGDLYFVDNGGKYHFDTCDRVADYGYNCPDAVRLTNSQINALATRSSLTSNVTNVNGIYHIDNGRRAQAIDAAALSAAGFKESTISLSPAALHHLPYSAPIMRDAIYVKKLGAEERGLWFSGALAPVSQAMHATGPFASRFPEKQLDPGAYDQLKKRAQMPPVVEDEAGTDFALSPAGRVRIDRGPGLGSPMQLPASIMNQLPVDANVIRDPAALKSPSAGTVYYVSGYAKRTFPGPEDRDAGMASMPVKQVITVSAPFFDGVANGPAYIQAGSVVKAASANAVYLSDGTTLHHIQTPALLNSLATKPIRVMPDAVIAGLTVGAVYTTHVRCGASDWLINGGQRYAVTTQIATQYGLTGKTPLTLETATCDNLPRSSAGLANVIRDAGGTAVYSVEAGKKRHIVSGAVLSTIAGGTTPTPADQALLGMLATMTPRVDADAKVQPQFIQASGQAMIYQVDGSTLRPITTWADYEYLAANAADRRIHAVSSATIAGFAIGPQYVRPGSVVRASNAPHVYLVDEGGKRLHVTTMDVPAALGAPASVVVTPGTVDGLTDSARASTKLRCGTTNMIGLGGALYAVPAGIAAHYGTGYVQVGAATCAAMKQATVPLDRFLRGPSGAVYLMENGSKRHIQSAATLTSLGGAAKVVNASQYSVDQFPTGTPIP